MLVHQLPGGDTIEHRNGALITTFTGERAVLCTCPPNGGIHRHLTHVFNHDAKDPADGFCRMYADDMSGHMAEIARRLGLDPATSAGLTTAADMENAVIKAETYDNFTVTALVTGGIDKNGGRVGDRADWHENGHGGVMPAPGTINILLFVNARLTDTALLQALTTCTEAKCAVCQELLAPSMYSCGIATGSGTDGTVIVGNEESDVVLTNAGKHYKLGEVIGRVVMAALRETLQKQTDLSPAWQHNALRRMSRFGVKMQDFAEFPAENVITLAESPIMLTKTSLFVHLIDQLTWGLISADEAGFAAAHIATEFGLADTTLPKNTDDMVALWRRIFTHCLLTYAAHPAIISLGKFAEFCLPNFDRR